LLLQFLRYFLGKVMTLDEIGLEHGTDKASTKNDFLSRYEPFLASKREGPVKLLEIGVLGGASIRTWRDYFENGTIIGADINPDVAKYADDRIAIEIIDQSSPTDLEALASKGPFDVIIDDGSHIWSHQILTLRKLLPVLKPEGIFIIEDLDTSHGKYKREYGSPGHVTAHEYLQRISDWTVGIWVKDRAEIDDDFLIEAAGTLEFVAFSRGAAILKKKASR
jgi:predicted O-methyltransferase YrrM